MADTIYSVVIDIATNMGGGGNSATMSKLDAMEKSIGSVSSAASDLGGKLSDAFTGAVEKAADLALSMGKLGIVAGAGAITYGVAKLNNELEKTQISLGAIFNANGVGSNIDEGFQIAGKTMQDMRKDAAALPGEFQDLVGIFKDISVPGFQAGADQNRLRKVSSGTMAVSAVMGLNMEQAGREMAMLMQGRAGAHNILGMRLAGLGGDEAKKFNEKSAADRLTYLEGALGKYSDAIKLYSNSFDGLSSTLVDNGKKFLSSATEGLFGRIKGVMASANQWFDDNQLTVSNWAHWIGSRLEYAFDVGRDKIIEWWPIIVNFAEKAYDRIASLFSRLEPFLNKLGGKAGGLLKDPDGTLDKLGGILGAYAGIKSAGPLAPLISGLGDAAGGALGIGGAGAGAVGAVAVAGFAVAVAGAFDAITNSSAAFHDTAVNLWDDIMVRFGAIGENFVRMEPALMKVADFLGVTLLSTIDYTLIYFQKLTDAIVWIGTTASKIADFIPAEIERMKVKLGIDTPKIAGDDRVEPISRDFDISRTSAAFVRALDEHGDDSRKKKNPAIPAAAGVSIAKVEITVSGNNDPSRVARIVSNHLSNMARNPKVSLYAPNYSR